MVKLEREGGRPVNRPRSWEEDKRQKKKHLKKQNRFHSGGHHVPVFVPHTPGSELARRMRIKEEENNQGRKISPLIFEHGGTQIHHLLWKPKPWAGGKCESDDCLGVWETGKEPVGGRGSHTPSSASTARRRGRQDRWWRHMKKRLAERPLTGVKNTWLPWGRRAWILSCGSTPYFAGRK